MTTPTEGQLKALRVIERLEQGESVMLNTQDANKCEDQNWAEAQPGGGYRLTVKGRLILHPDQ